MKSQGVAQALTPLPRTPLTSTDSFTSSSRIPIRLGLEGGMASTSSLLCLQLGEAGDLTDTSGQGQVTVGTPLPQEIHLLPSPFPAPKLGCLSASSCPPSVGECSQGHQLPRQRAQGLQQAAEQTGRADRNRCSSPHSSNSPCIRGREIKTCTSAPPVTGSLEAEGLRVLSCPNRKGPAQAPTPIHSCISLKVGPQSQCRGVRL